MSYAIRSFGPQIIVKSTGSTLQMSLFDLDTGELATLASATVSVYDENGTSVSSGSATISNNVASYSVTSGSVSAEDYNQYWTVEWTTPLGIFIQHAALVRTSPHCPISTDDILDECPELYIGEWRDSQGEVVDWSRFIRAAYKEFYSRLSNNTRWPWKIVNPWTFRSFLINWTLMRIYESLMTDGNTRYETLANRFGERAEDEWTRIQLIYDTNEDRGRNNKSADPVIYLGSAPWRW